MAFSGHGGRFHLVVTGRIHVAVGGGYSSFKSSTGPPREYVPCGLAICQRVVVVVVAVATEPRYLIREQEQRAAFK